MLNVVSCCRGGGHGACCFCRNLFFFQIQSVTDQPLDDAIELVFFLSVAANELSAVGDLCRSEVLDLMEAVLYVYIYTDKSSHSSFFRSKAARPITAQVNSSTPSVGNPPKKLLVTGLLLPLTNERTTKKRQLLTRREHVTHSFSKLPSSDPHSSQLPMIAELKLHPSQLRRH
jgi:hypothetical protein